MMIIQLLLKLDKQWPSAGEKSSPPSCLEWTLGCAYCGIPGCLDWRNRGMRI